MNKEDYKIGEKYSILNYKASRPNVVTRFIFIDWENDYVALMFHDRYGYVRVSKDNLDRHNQVE